MKRGKEAKTGRVSSTAESQAKSRTQIQIAPAIKTPKKMKSSRFNPVTAFLRPSFPGGTWDSCRPGFAPVIFIDLAVQGVM
jgi:hypothetical protein